MTRTEEMQEVRAELFRIRFEMQLYIRDEERYTKLKRELIDTRHKLARLKLAELNEQKANEENKERGMKNGKF